MPRFPGSPGESTAHRGEAGLPGDLGETKVSPSMMKPPFSAGDLGEEAEWPGDLLPGEI